MPTLKQVYDDPKTTSRDPYLLASRAGVQVATAKKFLRTQIGNLVNEKHVPPPQGSVKYCPAGSTTNTEW
jgi:hypothetical protein